jgi:hypothetical protein
MSEVKDRYDFTNGWTIFVDRVTDGRVYFQRFPPGATGPITDALRIGMPITEFLAAVNKQREEEAIHA